MTWNAKLAVSAIERRGSSAIVFDIGFQKESTFSAALGVFTFLITKY
jgi:hypothetical protein